jgi:flagellar motor component MotA
MMTQSQTIQVSYENVTTLARQLRAAGAVLKVAKSVENFIITIMKQPQLTSIEEILTSSESFDKFGVIAEDAVVENIKLPTEIEATLEEAIKSIKKNTKKSIELISNSDNLPAVDNDDDIPF